MNENKFINKIQKNLEEIKLELPINTSIKNSLQNSIILEKKSNKTIEYNLYFYNIIKNINSFNYYFINSINNNIIDKVVNNIKINKKQKLLNLINKEKKIMNDTKSLSFNVNLKNDIKKIEYYENKIKNHQIEEYLKKFKKNKIIIPLKSEEEKMIKNLDDNSLDIADNKEKINKIFLNIKNKQEERRQIYHKSQQRYLAEKKRKRLYQIYLEKFNIKNKSLIEKSIKLSTKKYKKMDFNNILEHQNVIDKNKKKYRLYSASTKNDAYKNIIKDNYKKFKNMQLKNFNEKLKLKQDYIKKIDLFNKKKKLDKKNTSDKNNIKENKTKLNKVLKNNKELKTLELNKKLKIQKDLKILEENNKKFLNVLKNKYDIKPKNITINVETKKPESKDYLQEFKETNKKLKYKSKLGKILANNEINWTSEDNSFIINEIDRLENIVGNHNEYDILKNKHNIDSLYLNSIKAKIRLLKDNNSNNLNKKLI